MGRYASVNYEARSLKDFDTFSEWVEFQNNDYQYTKKIKYIFEFEGKCKSCELISSHPYWAYSVRKDLFKLIEQTKGLIAQTQKYIDKGGYYSGNAEGSISLQKESIKDYIVKLSNPL